MRIADDAGAAAILTDTATRGDVELDRGGGPRPPPLLVTDDGAGPGPGNWTMPDTDHDTLAVLQYTSGSTGDPKGVVITHGNLLHNSQNLVRVLGLDENTPLGGWIPHFHDMGLMGIILPPLLSGGGTVLMSPSTFLKRPHLWLHMIDRFGIHTSAAPTSRTNSARGASLTRRRRGSTCPAGGSASTAPSRSAPPSSTPSGSASPPRPAAGHPQPLLRHGRGDPLRLRRPRRPARLPADRRRGPRTRRVPARRRRRTRPPRRLLRHRLRRRTPCRRPRTHRVLPDGGVGEIWLRGPVIGHGYWNREATNAAEFDATTADGIGGHLRTGDLGTLYEGELYVTGRIKDVLNLRGRNLYPQDIEHELRAQQPELGSLVGACFAVPGEDAGRADVLVVTHEIRGVKEEERLRRIAADMRLTVAREFGAPVGAVLLLRPGGVRRTTSGKIQRSAMRELFRAGALDPTYADYQENLLRPVPAAAGQAAV